MNGWILYDKNQYNKNKWFADRLVEIGSRYCEVILVLAEDLHFGIKDGRHFFLINGNEVSSPDYVVCRTIYPLLSFALEQAGARVFNNSETSRICNDKRLTYSYVCSPDIPIADTFFYNKCFINDSSGNSENYPVVVKSSAGHGGEEVFLVNNSTERDTSISQINSEGYLAQNVCHPYGRDLRVYVLGNRIIASILRSSEGFRSNYSLGGEAAPYSLNAEQKNLVSGVVSRIPTQMDFVGVDFLMCDEGMLFNEIEDVVGTRMLYDIMNLDAAEMYIEYIIKKVGNK